MVVNIYVSVLIARQIPESVFLDKGNTIGTHLNR